jgi:hypothetical protein
MVTSPADNNEFELLPFLFDLDSTLSMFSLKFLRELSYGSFTWGIMPFISDLKALLNSLRDIFTSSRARFSSCTPISRKRDLFHSQSLDASWPAGKYFPAVLSIVSVVRAKGYTVYTVPDLSRPLNKALFLLDELGVHPDVKTAWDIIPLSFVVDYFIPIGDLLESIHSRGWGSTSTAFTGTFSLKADVTYTLSNVENGVQRYLPITGVSRVYRRSPVESWSAPAPAVEWQSPSLKEIFNTAYLTSVLKRVF